MTRVFSPGWVVITLLAAAGIVLAWLIYPTPIICPAIYPAPDYCLGDPRLLPAVVGTIVIAALWLASTVLRVWSVTWARAVGVVAGIAAVAAPIATAFAGGFYIALP